MDKWQVAFAVIAALACLSLAGYGVYAGAQQQTQILECKTSAMNKNYSAEQIQVICK